MNARPVLTCFAMLAAWLALPVVAEAPTPSSPHEALVQSFLTSYEGGTVPLEKATGQVREFTLEVHDIETEIAPGVKVHQWAFGFPGQPATVPGPELRVTEGDLVRITLKNTHKEPHTIHLHGIVSVAQSMDGVPHTHHEILPGQSYTYAFVANEAGTFLYHCHVQANLHVDMGMYGALIVEPRDPSAVIWHSEHTLILDEWDAHQNPEAATHHADPQYYLVNGKAHPLIPDLDIPDGEVSLLRLANIGDEPHSLHLHGMRFLVLAKDGADLPAPYRADTILIGPGERYDLLVKGRDGDFVFHDHAGSHDTNADVYPGGMHLLVHGGRALDEHGKPVPAPDTHDHDSMPSMAMDAPAAATQAPEQNLAALPLSTDNPVVVRAAGFAFSAPAVRVKAGTTLSWSNGDFVPHHLVIEGPQGEPVNGPLPRGGRWSFTPTKPGVYKVHCQPHPFMTMTILVEG